MSGPKLKRYDVGLHAAGTHLSIEVFPKRVEDPDGPYALYDEAQAEIDELRSLVHRIKTIADEYAGDTGAIARGGLRSILSVIHEDSLTAPSPPDPLPERKEER